MGTFPAYGMAGIGIAAAIGFVFALSFLSNSAIIDTGLIDRQSSSEPSSFLVQQKTGNSGGMNSSLFSDSQGTTNMEAADQLPASEENTSLMMKTESQVELRPTLVSITASDGASGETIGEVVSETEFQAGKPVFIKAVS